MLAKWRLFMAIPKYHQLFPLVLEILEDGRILRLIEINNHIIDKLNLSEEESQLMLPSGTQTVIRNRSDWASYYLRRAGLLKVEKKGHYQITDIGKDYIQQNGYQITLDDLNQFEPFRDFLGASRAKDSKDKTTSEGREAEQNSTDQEKTQTPEEQIEEAIKVLDQQLADDLIAEIMQMPPAFFEKLVLDLLIAMGYGGKDKRNSKLTPLSNDEGIDGLIKEDELGLDHIYIQAKRWKDPVGRTEIQRFVGALSGFGARKGVFITTSRFSNGAEEYASRQLQNKIVLISGERLARLMMAYSVGLNVENTYVLRKIDKDYFFFEE